MDAVEKEIAALLKEQRQAELEAEMVELGVERFQHKVRGEQERGKETNTPGPRKLMRSILAPDAEGQGPTKETLAERIVSWHKEVAGGKPKAGRPNIAAQYIEMLDPVVVAYLTTRAILDKVSERQKLASTAKTIADLLEDEVRFGTWEKENRGFIKVMVENMKVRCNNHYGRMRDILVGYEKRNDREWKSWPVAHKMHIGATLIGLFIEVTGLVERVDERSSDRKSRTFLKAKPETIEWIQGSHEFSSLLQPVLMPMVVPPKPWTNPWNGGYRTKSVSRPLAAIKTGNRQYLKDLLDEDMTEVYKALNAMQETRWAINGRILSTIEHIWRATDGMGVIASPKPIDLPPKPADIKENEEARRQWRRSAARVHTENRILMSKQLQVGRTLDIAKRFRDEEAIYFPHCMDFRGRAYAMPLFLNPQASDYAKALLTFADTKPLGRQGVKWLSIHLANTFGNDKESLLDRELWAEMNSEQIAACAEDPFGNRWWTEADSPFQFLAACFEWAGYLEHGEDYESSLPVAMDGSCNGLQHFSAQLRDEVGGEAVNLTPSAQPADIYSKVAEEVTALVSRDLETEEDEDKRALANDWLDSGKITRKVCKRPTMTLVYGATRYGMKDQVQALVREWCRDGEVRWPEDGWRHSTYLGDVIWEALSRVVVKAREAMDFLQECARVLSTHAKVPVTWKTPLGLPIRQEYRKQATTRVKTTLGGRQIFLSLRKDGGKVDGRRQAQSVAPNWVHSLDAAHLQLTVNRCKELGIDSFALVHDSYATHAADADSLGETLRQAFVDIHEPDWLAEFREGVVSQLPEDKKGEVPPLPEKGSLDLEDVKASAYFFA